LVALCESCEFAINEFKLQVRNVVSDYDSKEFFCSGSTIKAIEAVREFGCDIVMVVTLVDRLEGGTEKISKMGYHVHSIFTIDDF